MNRRMRAIQRKAKLVIFAPLICLVLVLICSLWLSHSHSAVLVGIPNETVAFDMTVSETIAEAGAPDEKYDEAGINRCTYVYHNKECFGQNATITYVFDGNEKDNDARVFEAYLGIDFQSRNECERITEELRKYFESMLKDDRAFDIKISEGPFRAWNAEDLEQECVITSSQKCVVIRSYNNKVLTYIYCNRSIIPRLPKGGRM